MKEAKMNRKAHLLAFVLGCSGAVVVPSFAHEVGHVELEQEEFFDDLEAELDPETQGIEPMILLPSYQCIWRRGDVIPSTGGLMVECKEGELPFASGMTSESKGDDCPITNLSPVRQGDGKIDGEALADLHPEVHGEPIESRVKDVEAKRPRHWGTARHKASHYKEIRACRHNEKQATLTLCCSRDFPFDSLNAAGTHAKATR